MTPTDDAPPREAFSDRAFAAYADAYAGVPDSWELALQAAIAALFEFLAERPEQTHACVAADCGADTLARRDETIRRFAELLRPGFETAASPPPPVIAEAIGGGVYELIRNHAVERRLDQLPGSAGDATIVALTPFMGTDRAAELALSTH